MRAILLSAAAVIGLAAPSLADQRFEALLAGHAILPAFTMALPPADAPRDALVSGKFAGPGNLRVDRPGSIAGDTGPTHGSRPTGISFPFIGQPVQGFSGIKPVAGEPGSFWVLTDNGFGNRRNSPDSLLMFHKIRPDWRSGQVELRQTSFLRDPLRRVPFRIAHEGTEARYLTGSDFDLPQCRDDPVAGRLRGLLLLAGLGAPAGRHGPITRGGVPPRPDAGAGGLRRVLGRPAAGPAPALRRGAGGREPHQHAALQRMRLRLRHSARPDRDGGAQPAPRGGGRPDHEPPPDGVRQEPPASARPAHPPRLHAQHRPRGDCAGAVGWSRPGPEGPAVSLLRRDVPGRLGGAPPRSGGSAPPAARGRLPRRVDPLPPLEQLLHQPDSHGADPGGGLARRRPERADRDARELPRKVLSREGQRAVRDWSNSASFNDPTSSITTQHGPQGQQWQIGEWRNEEFGRLSQELETSTDRARRRAAFRRMLEIAEREDPAYTVLHQSVNLTAKRREIRWKPGQSFQMDFRGRNWGA